MSVLNDGLSHTDVEMRMLRYLLSMDADNIPLPVKSESIPV